MGLPSNISPKAVEFWRSRIHGVLMQADYEANTLRTCSWMVGSLVLCWAHFRSNTREIRRLHTVHGRYTTTWTTLWKMRSLGVRATGKLIESSVRLFTQVVLMEEVEIDDVGAPAAGDWFLRAFGKGEATQRR